MSSTRPVASRPAACASSCTTETSSSAPATTDDDGRIRQLADVAPGTYRLVFHPDSPFFRRVEVEVVIEAGRDYHVPLLLSPYACAIYRGS